jgi:hypothetical protein
MSLCVGETQTFRGLFCECWFGLRGLLVNGKRDVGQSLIGGFFFVKSGLQQAGRVIHARCARNRKGGAIARDFVMLHLLRGQMQPSS